MEPWMAGAAVITLVALVVDRFRGYRLLPAALNRLRATWRPRRPDQRTQSHEREVSEHP
jgi:hypothetical protein